MKKSNLEDRSAMSIIAEGLGEYANKNAVQKAIEFKIIDKHTKIKGLVADLKTNYPTFKKLRDTGSIQAIEKVKTIAHVLDLTPNQVCGVGE